MHRSVLVFAGLALALAGCMGGGDATEATMGRPGTVDLGGQAMIVGTVTDEALLPVPGAQVVLDGGPSTTTDEAGAFQFERVEPGPHTLAASRAGYAEATTTVDAAADAVADVSLILVGIPGEVPYRETFSQDGFIGCGLAIRHPSDQVSIALCGPFAFLGFNDVDQFELHWPLGDLQRSSGAFAETTWTPNQASAAGMRVQWGHQLPDRTDTITWGVTEGRPPLALRIAMEDVVANLSEAGDPPSCTLTNCTWVSFHFTDPASLGPSYPGDVTVMTQQRFRDHLTVFHNQPLPGGFSAIEG